MHPCRNFCHPSAEAAFDGQKGVVAVIGTLPACLAQSTCGSVCQKSFAGCVGADPCCTTSTRFSLDHSSAHKPTRNTRHANTVRTGACPTRLCAVDSHDPCHDRSVRAMCTGDRYCTYLPPRAINVVDLMTCVEASHCSCAHEVEYWSVECMNDGVAEQQKAIDWHHLMTRCVRLR